MRVGYVTMLNKKVYGDYPEIYSIGINGEKLPFNSCYQFIEMTYNKTGSLVYPEYETITIDINDVWLIGNYSDDKRVFTNVNFKRCLKCDRVNVPSARVASICDDCLKTVTR